MAAVMVAGRMAMLATVVTMGAVITEGVDTMADTMAVTDGTDTGAIHTTVTDGDGDLVLAGRIGVGDIPMDITVTVPGITLRTLTTPIRIRAVREWATRVPMGMTILRQRILRRNPEPTRQDLGGRRPALRTRTTHPRPMKALLLRVRRFSPLTASLLCRAVIACHRR